MLMSPLFVILFAALFLFLPVTTGTVWVPPDSLSKETKEQHNGHDCNGDEYEQKHYCQLTF